MIIACFPHLSSIIFLDLQNIFQHFYGDMAAEVSGHYEGVFL